MQSLTNPIIEQSFQIIDSLIPSHHLTPEEYHIVRRIIHTTADFDFLHLFQCCQNAISTGIKALKNQTPIVVDVSMVRAGIKTLVGKTHQNPIVVAVKQAREATEGKTLTETGLLQCCHHYPNGIYVIGNAPTALIALCNQIEVGKIQPSLVVAAPVGFVSVKEAKAQLSSLKVPQILIKGNKGGSPVASAIINALLVMSVQST